MTATKWIAVKDKLPEEYRDVIVTDGDQAWSDYYAVGEWNTDADADITHWMPFPEPPKGVLHV